MPGPWDKYKPAEPAQDGPWARYGSQPKPDFSNVQASSRTMQGMNRQTGDASKSGTRRGLEMGLRSGLQAAGGLVGSIGGDAFNAFLVDPVRKALHTTTQSDLVTGNRFQPSPTYREVGSRLADMLGLAKPQDARERVLGDVGEALSGTGLTLGIGGLANAGARGVTSGLSKVGQFLTAQPKLQAVSAATGAGAAGITRESGGSPGQQLAAGLIGGLTPGAATAGSAAALRGVVRGRDGAQMRNTIADFNALGASPSVGQATGRWGLQGLENLLAGGPTSAGVMGRFAERQADNIGAGLGKMADNMTPNASAERAGRAIERGAETFKANVGATKRALYWQADQFIPASTQVPLSNTWQEVVRLTTPTAGAQATTAAMVNPKIAQLRQTLSQDLSANGGQVSYEALKRIRTEIGEALGDYSLVSDTPTREYKALYGALSRDMEDAAQSQGPAAVAAAKRANNYTRAAADRMETLSRVVDKNGGPERVFAAVMSGTRDGGTTLRSTMQSLPVDGQKALTAAVIKRMGMPTPGQAGVDAAQEFSAGTFLTNWNKVSPEARRALFDRYGPKFAEDMDRIARVADNIKTGSRAFQNPSGTANRAAALTYGASLVASMLDPSMATTGALVASGAAANAGSRLLTNPRIVRWLANATTLPAGSAAAQINALRRIGEKEKDDEAIALADELSAKQP